MQIVTARFGALEIDESKIITFPEGLPGFEKYRQFALFPHDSQGSCPFEWFQSVEDGGLAFLAMKPHQLFPDYQPRIPVTELESIHLEKGMPGAILYSLLTVPKGDPHGITANLLAPILLNSSAKLARQIVVSNHEEYSLRQRILPEKAN